MKKYILLVFTIFFIACQQKDEKIINSLQVLYYNGIFERVTAVSCDEIAYTPLKKDALSIKVSEDGSYVPKEAVILDTTLTDRKVLQEIQLELKKCKIVNDEYDDVRMKCYFFYKNGQKDSLCIGNITNYGIYNNQSIKLTNKFVYLIRENCGFYKWVGVDNMKYFDELNDSTFARKKVKSQSGEEY